MKNSDVLIVGTGALANFFGARLAASGTSISMLGTWPEGLSALQKNGIQFENPSGDRISYPVLATNNPQECAGASLALVLVKAWQTERAARQLTECLAPDGFALSLQNGLGNREILSAYLGDERVGAGVTTTGATLLGPGLVRPGGEGVISLGSHPHLGPMANLLKQANFNIKITSDLDALMWGKLVINAAINPLTALLRIPNGELLSRPSARSLMTKTAREVFAVASARGVRLPFDAPVSAAEDVARRTAENCSSMLQDINRGAPTEIDAICGAVVKSGEQLNVDTPINRSLWMLVKSMTTGDFQ
ncbi:MAG: 2-dehydropantoate 2-reductase [Anaerolineales bacterium]|nr:2-dehydropantoate 2-reductase [Chloroflexota bacterium]MBL6979824.1 2-dehydropantoate 2-reductase [Anaerolineales bacterium]